MTSDLPSDILAAVLSTLVAAGVGATLRMRIGTVLSLTVWHTAATLVYWYTTLANPADAAGYYQYGLQGRIEVAVGTPFVRSVCVILAQDLDLSMLGAFFVFGASGLAGLLLAAQTLQDIAKRPDGTVPLYVRALPFLPSLSFWSCAVGKDSVAFLGTALVVYASVRRPTPWQAIVVGAGVIGLVRPHMAGLVAAAAVVASLLGTEARSATQRVAGIAASLALAAAAVPFAIDYIGFGAVGDVSAGDNYEDMVRSYIDTRQGRNLEGNSSLNISELSFPAQLFTFMFRPLFFDALGAFGWLASLDNFVLLLLFGRMLPSLFRNLGLYRSWGFRLNVAYLVGGWTIMAVTTANLGLALRQKNMLIPSFLVIAAVAISGKRTPVGDVTSATAPTGAAAIPAPLPGAHARPRVL